MVCIKCGGAIPSSRRSEKYCSLHCSKLYLKSQSKKRNRDHQNQYQRQYRRAQNGGDRPKTTTTKLRANECLACGSHDDLQLAHVKPRTLGGTYDASITLCRDCHMAWDILNKEFWLERFNMRRAVAAARRLTATQDMQE